MSEEILSRIVENFIDGAKRATKGFDLKSATPIRKTDLDGSYALSASANKIDGASADTVRLQFRKFKREDKTRKAKQSRSKRERAKKRKPRLNKKDELVIREVIRDKDKRDINVSDELTFISRGIALS